MKKQVRIPIRITHAKKENLLAAQQEVYGDIKTTKEEIRKEIELYLKNKKEEMEITLIFLGDFTELAPEKQEEFLELALAYKENGSITDITLGAKADKLSKENLKRWKKYRVDVIELEAQTTNPYILQKIRADYKEEDIKKAAKKIRWNRFKLGFAVAVGLPESTSIDEDNTIKALLKLRPKSMRIYPILVIRNSELEQQWKNGEYEPLSIMQTIERCKNLVYLCNHKKVPNICVGIPNEGKIFDTDNKIVAGPFHPELAQMVESSIWYDSIVNNIKKWNTKVKIAKVVVNPEDVEKIMGFQEENIKKWQEVYDVQIEVEGKEEIRPGKMEIEILKTYEELIEEKIIK